MEVTRLHLLEGSAASVRLVESTGKLACHHERMASSSGTAEGGSVAARNDDTDSSQLAAMKAVYDVFDTSGDGSIQPIEIGAALRRLQLIKSRRQIQTIVDLVDVDGDGEISFEEFVTLMGRVKDEVEAKPEDGAETDSADGEVTPVALQLTKEQRQAKEERQAALFAFQRAVTMIAFTHLAKDDEKLMNELLDVLTIDPTERSEWGLQRLLMWAENYDPEKTGVDVGFKFILDLPPPSVSNVRIEVCRCMTVQRFDEGQTICKQGEEGSCMYVIMLGEVEVLTVTESRKEEHVAFLGPGRSVGELAVIGEDESDTMRTATLRAHKPCVLGVLSRSDYRRHILRMEQESKADLVETLLKVEYLRRVGRAGLLRLAMMMKPARFSRGEEICRQGVVPVLLTFVTSGSAMVTVHVNDCESSGELLKSVEVMEQSFDRSLDAVGISIAGDCPEPNRWGLRATTMCEGFTVAPNVARRVLNKRHVQDGYNEHVEAVDRMIARRVVESGEGDRARASLGFPSSPRGQHMKSKQRTHSHSSQAVSKPQSRPVFGVRLRGVNVTPRSLLKPGQNRLQAPSGSTKAPAMPPLKMLAGATSARLSNGKVLRGSPRNRAGLTARRRESQTSNYGGTIVTPRMPVATHGPHAARARALSAAQTG